MLKPISEAAKRNPTTAELDEAREIMAFIMTRPKRMRAGYLAYFLREAEETGRQKERQSLGPR